MAKRDNSNIIKFGIPSFDGLFNNPKPEASHGGRKILNPDFSNCGIAIPKKDSSSICIIGPDGVGKSVFAMHLASRYAAECQEDKNKPFVFYISTDLNCEIAERMWRHFSLNNPQKDRDPFSPGSGVPGARTITLKSCIPEKLDEILTEPHKDQVIFVDLAAHTAGDDWGFLHRFISVLDKPGSQDAKHLIIVDAVEGFETYVGDLDAFGEKTSRRARIAQIMRLVKDKSHVLLVVEESKMNERLPEEFVTDVVIRLQKTSAKDYVRRTVEINKARGQSYARGLHQYSIRSGKGSTTGTQKNADDPVFELEQEYNSLSNAGISAFSKDAPDVQVQSYVYFPHSLHYFHRIIMERHGEGKHAAPKDKFASFGIEYLDNMLAGQGEETIRKGGYDNRGLPSGTITALMGDTLTQKSRLGRAFLSQAFSSVFDIYADMKDSQNIRENAPKIFERINNILDLSNQNLVGLSKVDTSEIDHQCVNSIKRCDWKNVIKSFIKKLNAVSGSLENKDTSADEKDLVYKRDWLSSFTKKEWNNDSFCDWLIKNDNGVAVMLTTNDITQQYLVERFIQRLEPKYTNLTEDEQVKLSKKFRTYMEENTICRRIEIHDISSSTMLNIFSKTIWEAQRKLMSEDYLETSEIIYDRVGRIRVVIDDFNNFRNIYADLTEDPLLLPSIKFLLGRSGVTTLIIDTQTGKPDIAVGERFASELRQMADSNLYTWRVPFYGENRVAITAIPPLSLESIGIVRELRETNQENTSLDVDPHFELYLGLEEGKPQPVPLEVRLFADVPSFDSYIDEENLLFKDLFTPVASIFDNQGEIIVKFPASRYDILRNMSYLQRDTRLDHTLIAAVDEFWGIKLPERRRSGAFRPQWNYLNAVTRKGKFGSKDIDPYSVFQKGATPIKNDAFEKRRRYFFDDGLGYNFIGMEDSGELDEQKSIERVPFAWDFGFVLCKKEAWEKAVNKRLSHKNNKLKVGDIWDKLMIVPQERQKLSVKDSNPSKLERGSVSWRDFLDACQNVAEAESVRIKQKIHPFDSSLITPETFSCLFLEIWASEIFDSLKKKNIDAANKFAQKLSTHSWADKRDNIDLPTQQKDAGKNQNLINWLDRNVYSGKKEGGYTNELYKTWLLLVDVLNFSEIVNSKDSGTFEFKPRSASGSAVATRQWYKTACHWINENANSELIVAAPLPGHFSIRGDWFLAVAGGSRSSRLGDRALDILCSRRANIVRLQKGLGLPTRYLEQADNLRTGLVLNGEYGTSFNVEYKAVKELGAIDGDKNFHWLRRSSLIEYHRHSRIWHKWLNKVMNWWVSKKLLYQSSWKGGFYLYDNFVPGKSIDENDNEFEMRNEFFVMCDYLKVELLSASIDDIN